MDWKICQVINHRAGPVFTCSDRCDLEQWSISTCDRDVCSAASRQPKTCLEQAYFIYIYRRPCKAARSILLFYYIYIYMSVFFFFYRTLKSIGPIFVLQVSLKKTIVTVWNIAPVNWQRPSRSRPHPSPSKENKMKLKEKIAVKTIGSVRFFCFQLFDFFAAWVEKGSLVELLHNEAAAYADPRDYHTNMRWLTG